MPSKGNHDRLVLDRKDRRLRLFRPGGPIGDRGPGLPLGDRLLIDPVALRQRSQALLTMLYRSTDRLCRRGAPVENLAHSASLQSVEKIAPSKPGIKHQRFSSAPSWQSTSSPTRAMTPTLCGARSVASEPCRSSPAAERERPRSATTARATRNATSSRTPFAGLQACRHPIRQARRELPLSRRHRNPRRVLAVMKSGA